MNTLEALYALEHERHSRGDYNSWVSIDDLYSLFQEHNITKTRAEIRHELDNLWKTRTILQVGPREAQHTFAQATILPYDEPIPTEYNDVRAIPPYRFRQVAIFDATVSPRYRSRIAEIARLLSFNYQRYDMKPSTALVRHVTKRQTRPAFDEPLDSFFKQLSEAIGSNTIETRDATFSISQGTDHKTLARAVNLVGEAVKASFDAAGRELFLARFQTDAITHTLAGLYSKVFRREVDGHIITAGVGSGKTYAFQIGALIHVTYLAKLGKKRPSVLFLYPRVVLARNQILEMENLVKRINSIDLTLKLPLPFLDAGGQLAQSGQPTQNRRIVRGALPQALRKHYQQDYQVIVSNLDTIANRVPNPESSPYLAEHLDLIVIDEAHLFSGLYGAHARALLQRVFLHKAISQQRNGKYHAPFSEIIGAIPRSLTASKTNPYIIGASATISEPRRHLARLLTTGPDRIRHINVPVSEQQEKGHIHHLLLRQRYQCSSITAATNAVSCVVHNRRDGLVQDYYSHEEREPISKDQISNPVGDPSPPLRNVRNMRKALGFSNSLDAVNRWADYISDNEFTKRKSMKNAPQIRAIPYFARFAEPLWRTIQLQSFEKKLSKWRTSLIEYYGNLCRKCKEGVPLSIPRIPEGSKAIKSRALKLWDANSSNGDHYLSQLGISPEDWNTTRFSCFQQQSTSTTISNLDKCSFFLSGLCWWWSEDNLGDNSPQAVSDDNPLNGFKKLNEASRYFPLAGIRVNTITSKKEIPPIRECIDEIFQPPASLLFRTGKSEKGRSENCCFLIGSPRIEVGIDLSNVTEGLTYRAMRDPAGLQQKVGRIGREPGADVLVVHIVTENIREQYYLRNPELALDPDHLQPIPLHENNLLIRRSHLYMAVFDFILHQIHGPSAMQIQRGGSRIFLINDPDEDKGNSLWADKLTGLVEFLFGPNSGNHVRDLYSYLSRLGGDTSEVAETIASIRRDCEELLGWSSGKGPNDYSVAEMIADYTFEPSNPPETAPERVKTLIRHLPSAVKDRSYLYQIFGLGVFHSDRSSSHPYAWSSSLFTTSGKSFVHIVSQDNGWTNQLDYETTQTVLSSLCPGTVTYRYRRNPDKVRISSNPHRPHAALQQPGIVSAYVDVDNDNLFEADSCPPLSGDELPQGAPISAKPIKVFRPRQVILTRGKSSPLATSAGLLADGDECPENPDALVSAGVPPRCFPLRWFRTRMTVGGEAIQSRMQKKYQIHYGPETQPLASIFDVVEYHSELEVTEFVWGLDRQFSNRQITNSRLHYRDQSREPVVLGHSYVAPALSFHICRDNPYVCRTIADVLSHIETATHQSLLFHALTFFLSEHAVSQPSGRRRYEPLAPSPFAVRDLSKIIWFHLLSEWVSVRTADQSPVFSVSDVQNALTGTRSVTEARYIEICHSLARVQDPDHADDREASLRELYPHLLSAMASHVAFNTEHLERSGRRLLGNSLGIAVHTAGLRASGAEDSDLRYFYKVSDDEITIFLFDSDERGNGAIDAVRDNYFILTVEHALEDKKLALGLMIDPLADTDFISEFEKSLCECPMTQAAIFAFHSLSPSVPYGPAADIVESERLIGAPLYEFIRHKVGVVNFDHIGVFQQCPEFLVILGERLGSPLIPSEDYPAFHALDAACHFCFDGCISCLVAPEANARGPLTSDWDVSKLLLDRLYQVCIDTHPSSPLIYPGKGVGRTLPPLELARYQASALATPTVPTSFRVVLSDPDKPHSVECSVTPTVMIGRPDVVLRPTLDPMELGSLQLRLRMRT